NSGSTLLLIYLSLHDALPIWYRNDRYFEADTEAAIEPSCLEKLFCGFTVERSFAVGGPAYFGVLNSLVLRIPLGAKKFIAPPLLDRKSTRLNSSHVKISYAVI